MNDKLEISINELSHYESLKKQDSEHRRLIKKLQVEIKAMKQGQSLVIDSVSQQRELLLAFFDLADELPMGLIHYDREKIVEEFLANNCG